MLRWVSRDKDEQRLLKLGLDTSQEAGSQRPLTQVSMIARFDIAVSSNNALQGTFAVDSVSMSLTSATYASLQGSSSNGDSRDSSSGGISALLANLQEFPDMLTEGDKRMRLDR
jgi:hypothetical protein